MGNETFYGDGLMSSIRFSADDDGFLGSIFPRFSEFVLLVETPSLISSCGRAYSVLSCIVWGSNQARFPPRLVSFWGLSQILRRASPAFHMSVPHSPGVKYNNRQKRRALSSVLHRSPPPPWA